MGFFSDLFFGSSDDDQKKKHKNENSGLPFGISQFDIEDYKNGADYEDEFDDSWDDEE